MERNLAMFMAGEEARQANEIDEKLMFGGRQLQQQGDERDGDGAQHCDCF